MRIRSKRRRVVLTTSDALAMYVAGFALCAVPVVMHGRSWRSHCGQARAYATDVLTIELTDGSRPLVLAMEDSEADCRRGDVARAFNTAVDALRPPCPAAPTSAA